MKRFLAALAVLAFLVGSMVAVAHAKRKWIPIDELNLVPVGKAESADWTWNSEAKITWNSGADMTMLR